MSPTSSTTPATPRKTPAKRPKAAAGGASDTGLPDDERAALDEAITRLEEGTRVWVALTLDQRARLLGRVRDAVGAVAQEWADAATMSKGLEPGHPFSAEEWLGGPYAVIGLLDALRETLERPREGPEPARRRDDRPGAGRAPACAHVPAERHREVPAVGVHRRGLVRARCDRGSGPPRGRAGAADPDRVRRCRAGARRGQRHLDPRRRRAVRALRAQPRRPAEGQPDAGRPRPRVRARAGAAHRAGAGAHRARRCRDRRVPDIAPAHRSRAHHRLGSRRSTRSCGVPARTPTPRARPASRG